LARAPKLDGAPVPLAFACHGLIVLLSIADFSVLRRKNRGDKPTHCTPPEPPPPPVTPKGFHLALPDWQLRMAGTLSNWSMSHDENRESFGERLRNLREKAGLTRGDLAIKAGLDLKTIWSLEGDKTRPGWDTVCLLADALGRFQGVFHRRPGQDRLDAVRRLVVYRL
jgi:DNA-binding XRE family transcriptional regulator